MTALLGVVLLAVSSISFWYLLPTNGEEHWLFSVPGLEAYVPIFIISGAAVGIVMIFAAVL
jgi:hypothetical protein